MSKNMNLDKSMGIPQHVDFRDVEVGDVLFFRTPLNPNSDHLLIESVQYLVRGSVGEAATSHVAVVVGIEKDEYGRRQPIIAHTTVRGEEGTPEYKPGYVKETLQYQVEREGDRSFVIFRPEDKDLRDNIAAIASDEQEYKDIIWEWKPAVKAFLKQFHLSPKRMVDLEKNMNKHDKAQLAMSSICTQFVIQVIKAAGRKTAMKRIDKRPLEATKIPGYLHVPDESMPKFLESHLASRSDYTRLTYLGQDPIKKIKDEINAQINRLDERRMTSTSAATREKLRVKIVEIKKDRDKALREIDAQHYTNETEACAHLINRVLPSLKIKTGLSLFKATSAVKILRVASSTGIFSSHLRESAKRLTAIVVRPHNKFVTAQTNKLSAPKVIETVQNESVMVDSATLSTTGTRLETFKKMLETFKSLHPHQSPRIQALNDEVKALLVRASEEVGYTKEKGYDPERIITLMSAKTAAKESEPIPAGSRDTTPRLDPKTDLIFLVGGIY